MIKKLFIFFCLLSVSLHARVIEIKLNQNEDFHLYNAVSENGWIRVAKGDSAFRNFKDSIFFSFEKGEGKSGQKIENQNTDTEIDQEGLLESNISVFEDAVFGKTSGLFYNVNSFLRFSYPKNFYQGLVVEFWLKPFTTEEGTLLSAEMLPFDKISRNFLIYLKKGKLCFRFENLFIDTANKEKFKTIEFDSKEYIPTKEWSHNKITYNPAEGLLSYYLNGKLVVQVFATEDGTAHSPLMYLEVPEDWEYILGKGYRGLLDNFFLSGDFKQQKELSVYNQGDSFIQTKVFRLETMLSIYDLELIQKKELSTYATLQYRASREPFAQYTPEEMLPWQDYNIEKAENPKITARYIQFRISLFSSSEGKISPSVAGIRIKYDLMDIPSIPLDLQAESSETKVRLQFRESSGKNIIGYKIYYGVKTNEYLSKDANEGASPIFIPLSSFIKDSSFRTLSYYLTGLEYYKVYFIRVAAVNDEGLESLMSDETLIRVRKLK